LFLERPCRWGGIQGCGQIGVFSFHCPKTVGDAFAIWWDIFRTVGWIEAVFLYVMILPAGLFLEKRKSFPFREASKPPQQEKVSNENKTF
jgi:hypothetical protein